MTLVRSIMSSPVITADVDTDVPALIALLLEHDISALPIVDATGALAGIVSEADLVAKEAYAGHRRRPLEALADLVNGGETAWALKGRARTAAEIMTPHPDTADPDEDVRALARRMVEARRKRVPVVEGGTIVGIVARADLLRGLTADA